MKNTIDARDAAIIRRAQRLMLTTRSDGWKDVVAIMQEVVDDCLEAVKKYKGMDEHEMATLTYVWKTADAQKANLLATIESRIDEGGKLAASYQSSKEPQPPAQLDDEGPMVASSVTIPVCDMPAGTDDEDLTEDEEENAGA